MRMQDEKGTVIGEKSMKNEEYKKLSIKEFTKAAGRYDIFTVLLSEGDTTITLLCERVNSTAQFCKLLKEIYCYMIT